ncbi:unnamed protein product [Protopolystoma xenopodis]|uniref:Uncharacterized protein n=1 Tax=Protopolystoma xenopodis TaxID=117903 RepID=A0A448WLL3_9PLAT|nr:unnamed protein product [Protopolystoma xenopodis]
MLLEDLDYPHLLPADVCFSEQDDSDHVDESDEEAGVIIMADSEMAGDAASRSRLQKKKLIKAMSVGVSLSRANSPL